MYCYPRIQCVGNLSSGKRFRRCERFSNSRALRVRSSKEQNEYEKVLEFLQDREEGNNDTEHVREQAKAMMVAAGKKPEKSEASSISDKRSLVKSEASSISSHVTAVVPVLKAICQNADQLDKRFDQLGKSFDQLDKSFDQLDKIFDKSFDQLDKRLDKAEEKAEKRFRMIEARFLGGERRFIVTIWSLLFVFFVFSRQSTIESFTGATVDQIANVTDFLLVLAAFSVTVQRPNAEEEEK